MKKSKKRKNERDTLLNMLRNLGIEHDEFTDPKFIISGAVEDGAVYTICIRRVLDLAFDRKGNLLGTFTEAAGSYRRLDVQNQKGR